MSPAGVRAVGRCMRRSLASTPARRRSPTLRFSSAKAAPPRPRSWRRGSPMPRKKLVAPTLSTAAPVAMLPVRSLDLVYVTRKKIGGRDRFGQPVDQEWWDSLTPEKADMYLRARVVGFKL